MHTVWSSLFTAVGVTVVIVTFAVIVGWATILWSSRKID